eukprot:gene11976-2559_t
MGYRKECAVWSSIQSDDTCRSPRQQDQYSKTTSGRQILGTRFPLFNEILAHSRSHSGFLAWTAHGAEWSIDDDLLSKLKEYVCNIFGKEKKDLNARSNYIAEVWRSSLQAHINFADLGQDGWSADGKIVWINAAFPEEVEQIFAGEESNDESSDESEDEESKIVTPSSHS